MSYRTAPRRRTGYNGQRRSGGSLRTFMTLLALVLAAAILLWLFMRDRSGIALYDELAVELGGALPPAASFVKDGEVTEISITNAAEIDTNKIGRYTVKLTVNGRKRTAAAVVTDTTPPAAEAVPQYGPAGTAISAGEFVGNLSDFSQVAITFVREPDYTLIGQQTVQLLLRDDADNTTLLTTTLTLYDPMADLDTTPPTADVLALDAPVGTELPAADFVENIRDESDVTVSYLVTPDFTQNIVHEITVLVTDIFGNSLSLETTLDLWNISRRPVIEGAADITVEIGEAITYRTGVTANDDIDGELTLSIDSGAVDTMTAGTYPVTYAATDSHNNTAEVTITVTVTPFDTELLYGLAEEIMSGFIKDDMTDMQKVKAVYNWTMDSIGYINHGDKYDFHKIAYQGLKTRQGDCYTYCVVAQVFFDLLEIEYLPIERVGGTSQHFWSLVNLGDGWYHFDATPHKKRYNTCMITESRAQEIAADRGNNYYTYDAELYPEIVS